MQRTRGGTLRRPLRAVGQASAALTSTSMSYLGCCSSLLLLVCYIRLCLASLLRFVSVISAHCMCVVAAWAVARSPSQCLPPLYLVKFMCPSIRASRRHDAQAFRPQCHQCHLPRPPRTRLRRRAAGGGGARHPLLRSSFATCSSKRPALLPAHPMRVFCGRIAR